jgi:hypothetical protein
VACKFVQVEEEKEASRTIRTVDPMKEYMMLTKPNYGEF